MSDLPESVPALRWREITLPDQRFVIHALSDIHIAAGRHQSKELARRLKAIKDAGPSHRLICHGDWADVRTRNSKGFAHGVMTPEMEQDSIVAMLKPLADRIDLMIPGNHEDRIERDTGLDFMGNIAALIGVPESYRSGPTVIRYKFSNGEKPRRGNPFPNASVTGLVHHGAGGGSAGASVNRLAGMVRSWTPDVSWACMGHVHHTGVFPISSYLGFPPKPHSTMLFLTGTAADHEDYAQKMGLAPSWVGAPEIHVDYWRTNEDRGVRVSGWVR